MASKDKEYERMTKKASSPSPKLKNMILAFVRNSRRHKTLSIRKRNLLKAKSDN